MNKLIAASFAMFFAVSAHAAEAPAKNSQQSKMASCNADAKELKGDDRKVFMKECLSAKPAKPATQQDKMKTCNANATGKKGDERKAFMKECLSSKKAA
jgi:hypothetical protein